MRDPFRPQDALMAEIYDTFQEAAKDRAFDNDDWMENERNAVHGKALEIAKREDLREPSLDVIKRYESNAYGHVDYGKKWAMGIVEWMREQNTF